MQKIVMCFDRDQTVDVNPHHSKDSVPLSWIQLFAHKCDRIDVWATGNEQLQIEAGIPTPYEAKKILKENNYTVNKSLDSRREGLDIIQMLYTEVASDDTLLVVDDENLLNYANSNDWIWYEPWEFYNNMDKIIDDINIKDPRDNNMSGEPYFDTTRYDTYHNLLNRLENKL